MTSQPAAAQTPFHAADAAPPDHATARPAVLVVEDESVVAMDLDAQLRDMGYRVCGCVDNGNDAIARARAERPDLILMDIVLRGGTDGIAAAGVIGRELHIPVLFLTAYSDDQTVARAAGASPYGYLTKPFQSRELRAGIEVALRKAEVERRLRDSERWLASVLHGVGDAVIATDGSGRVGLANPAAETLLGAGALHGRPAAEVVRLADHGGGPLSLPPDCGASVSGAGTLLAHGGMPVPVDFSAGPICDERGQSTGVAIVLHDMRERVAAEQRLARSEYRFAVPSTMRPRGWRWWTAATASCASTARCAACWAPRRNS